MEDLTLYGITVAILVAIVAPFSESIKDLAKELIKWALAPKRRLLEIKLFEKLSRDKETYLFFCDGEIGKKVAEDMASRLRQKNIAFQYAFYPLPMIPSNISSSAKIEKISTSMKKALKEFGKNGIAFSILKINSDTLILQSSGSIGCFDALPDVIILKEASRDDATLIILSISAIYDKVSAKKITTSDNEICLRLVDFCILQATLAVFAVEIYKDKMYASSLIEEHINIVISDISNQRMIAKTKNLELWELQFWELHLEYTRKYLSYYIENGRPQPFVNILPDFGSINEDNFSKAARSEFLQSVRDAKMLFGLPCAKVNRSAQDRNGIFKLPNGDLAIIKTDLSMVDSETMYSSERIVIGHWCQ